MNRCGVACGDLFLIRPLCGHRTSSLFTIPFLLQGGRLERRAGASPAPTILLQTAGDVVGATLVVARKKTHLNPPVILNRSAVKNPVNRRIQCHRTGSFACATRLIGRILPGRPRRAAPTAPVKKTDLKSNEMASNRRGRKKERSGIFRESGK